MKKTLTNILIFVILLFIILLAIKIFKKPVPTNELTDQNPPEFIYEGEEMFKVR